jgi:hypothetical protein
MSKPVDFLTASGEELWTAFCQSDYITFREFVAQVVIPQTAAAAEAKVRGECEGKSTQALRVRLANFKARVERAERERERIAKIAQDDDVYLNKQIAELRSQLADAERKGGYEALTKYAETYCDAFDASYMFRFRDQHYAPPAPSVRLSNGECIRYDGKVRYRGLTWDSIPKFLQRENECGYVLSDAEYTALVALAQTPESRP